jgi:ribonuclease Z
VAVRLRGGNAASVSAHPYHPGKLNKIFITHLHGDHLFGLPGLLCSRSMQGNSLPLTLYGPKGLKAFVETALRLSGPGPITR